MYSTNLFHQKLAQICTNLYLTRSWHKCVQISFSQDAGKNMYKSLSLSLEIEIVYACLAPLPHADTPPPPHTGGWQAGFAVSSTYPLRCLSPPPPSPLLPAKPESMVGRWGWGGGGGGDSVAAVGWRSHSLSQQAVTKLYTYHCNIILALGFN